jgi:hypothetical protein
MKLTIFHGLNPASPDCANSVTMYGSLIDNEEILRSRDRAS